MEEIKEVQGVKYLLFKYNSVDDFIINFSFKNGIHQIVFSDIQNLDILIQGVEFYKENNIDFFMVVFTAAVSAREKKQPPFFSGKSLSISQNIPLVSISDPTLMLDNDITLAWYAGNRYIPNLQFIISQIIDKISISINKKPFIIGGSGAGFSALVQSILLKSEAIICIWNPQTNIDAYLFEPVKKYYTVAFNKKSIDDSDSDSLSLPMQFEFPTEYISKINFKDIKSNKQILYFQNISDWHMQKHCASFLTNLKLNRYFDSIFTDERGKIVFYFGNWGKGHVVPPINLLKDVFKKAILSNNIFFSTVSFEQNKKKYGLLSSNLFLWQSEKKEFPFYIKYDIQDLSVEITAYSYIDDSSINYAFYLLRNKKRIDLKWYSNQKQVKFLLSEHMNNLGITLFVKDIKSLN